MALDTHFAPAARATRAELDQAIRHFEGYAHLVPFLAAVPNIYLVLNHHRQIVFANHAVFEALNTTPDQVYGLRPGEALACVHAFETDGGCGTSKFCHTCGAVRAILAGLRGQHAAEECRIEQQGGSALDLRVYTTPLVVDGDRYTIFTIEDISAEKRRLALERIFFHDVLNTAGVLTGYAEALRDGTLPTTSDMLDLLLRYSSQLIAEITAQRDLNDAETGDLIVNPMPLNALDMVQRQCDYYRNHHVAQHRTLTVAPDAASIMIDSDPVLLARVLGNMIKNALEATPPDGTVTVTCTREQEANAPRAVFAVHNPTAMPRSVQLQVFTRSFSTKGKDRGLGTYSMRLLTERYLGGRVSFTSSPEAGTTFRVALPVERSNAGSRPCPLSAGRPSGHNGRE